MAVHLATLELLEKRFAPEDARAIAQAIEEETSANKFVTTESLRVQLAELETRLVSKMFTFGVTFGLTGAGLIITAVFFMLQNLKR